MCVLDVFKTMIMLPSLSKQRNCVSDFGYQFIKTAFQFLSWHMNEFDTWIFETWPNLRLVREVNRENNSHEISIQFCYDMISVISYFATASCDVLMYIRKGHATAAR